MDLHLHTPASNDYLQPKATYLEWLQAADAKGLEIVAITDHNTVAGIAVQWGNLEDRNPSTGPRVTVAELARFAQEELKLDFIF